MIEALSASSPVWLVTWSITLTIAPIASTRPPRSEMTRRASSVATRIASIPVTVSSTRWRPSSAVSTTAFRRRVVSSAFAFTSRVEPAISSMLLAVCSAASTSAPVFSATCRALCTMRSIESEISSARVEKSVALPESSSPIVPSSRNDVDEPSTARSRACAECARRLGDPFHLIGDAIHARDRDRVARHLLGGHARETLRHQGDAGGRIFHAVRGLGHATDGGPQALDHRRDRARDVAELVAAIAADADREVAHPDPLYDLLDLEDRLHEAARKEHARAEGRREGEHSGEQQVAVRARQRLALGRER